MRDRMHEKRISRDDLEGKEDPLNQVTVLYDRARGARYRGRKQNPGNKGGGEPKKVWSATEWNSQTEGEDCGKNENRNKRRKKGPQHASCCTGVGFFEIVQR